MARSKTKHPNPKGWGCFVLGLPAEVDAKELPSPPVILRERLCVFARNSFFLFSSRKDAKPQRNCGPHAQRRPKNVEENCTMY